MAWPACPPPSSPSPTPATAETVLPHGDLDPTHLADQASHLTLSAGSSPPLRASSQTPPLGEPDGHDSAPRQRTCTERWIVEPLPSTTASTPGPAADAQPGPPTTRDHARGGSRLEMRSEGRHAADQDPQEGGRQWPTSTSNAHHHGSALVSGRASEDPGPCFVKSDAIVRLADLPNEVLLHILGFLDVPELLVTSRVSEPAIAPAVSIVNASPSLLTQGLRHPCWQRVSHRP